MPEIFINYRTDDGESVAAWLDRELSARFGWETIFRASKSIPLGDDYRDELLDGVRRSDALLALIGVHWLEARENDRRKLDLPDDWVRKEIIEAFDNGVRVIPVLLGSARLPTADRLPPELEALAVCQHTRLDPRNLDADIERLARELARLVPGLEKPEPPKPEAEGRIVNNVNDNARAGVVGQVDGNVTFGTGSFLDAEDRSGRGDGR
ncbi:toll/interleukin-1 receptor domain-containing protein [Actinomadura algeriensis]|uniref:TIR domain-containing protein n=1 Tax=Actinomadura algeriensis TaxID=1679523 RepID=A0ABR9JLM1_9ACTN|nr:toll/interleukin-1 receptor domain-containing protein [Actinomadura algeriensis]MBE1531457.1 hypothetical protein [Actinomadura algeriensis]